MKAASCRRVHQVWRRAGYWPEPRRSDIAVKMGNAIQQAHRVGMARGAKQGCGVCHLDQFAAIHHSHPLAGLSYNPHVMRDKDQAHPKLGLKGHQKAQDLVLNGHI